MRILGIVIAILLFMLIVIIHEAGHLFASKICGVRVLEFSIGMGPLIYQKKKNETEYSLRAIPLGGYCKLEAEDEESDSPSAFTNAVWWKKCIILFAGAFNNIVLCLLALLIIYASLGFYSPVLESVSEGSPAQLAGLQAGDKIVAVDGSEYEEWSDIVTAINSSGEEVEITYLRDKERNTVVLSAEYNEEAQRYLIGISCSIVHSPLKAAKYSFETCTGYFAEIAKFFGRLFKGNVESNDVVGVVGMVSMVSEEAQYGLVNVFYIMSMISLNLGVVNLLPFPALDGGRIVFVLLRQISGGKISQKVESYVNGAGLAILMALMIFLIFKDTFNLFV